ncbi:MAG: ABC transporter permease [Rhodospirillales bacterium]|nr:MAG: ABC transporter permease [Rhodospirillales bacterium]
MARDPAAGDRPRHMVHRGLVGLGKAVIAASRWLAAFAGVAVGVVVQACRPLTWRRPVRREFMRTMQLAGIGSLATIVVVAILVGFAAVFQALYWEGILGQRDQVGRVVVPLIVRDIGPLLVGLILIGRSGSAVLMELAAIRVGGAYHMLDAQGVDPFLTLVVPRVVGLALSSVCLAIIFVAVSLLSGFVLARALDAVAFSLWQFLDHSLGNLATLDAVVLVLKSTLIGGVIGIVSTMAPLASPTAARDVNTLVPTGFVHSILAILLVSGLVGLVF